jgi:hypothetical protein
VPFRVRCGIPCGSSWLGRYGLVNLEAPKSGQDDPTGYKSYSKGKVVATRNP